MSRSFSDIFGKKSSVMIEEVLNDSSSVGNLMLIWRTANKHGLIEKSSMAVQATAINE